MFIVDHLGAMEPAPSVLVWPCTLHVPGHAGVRLPTREVIYSEILRARGAHPRRPEVDDIVAGHHAKHSFPVIAGHLLPEDYV